MTNSKELVNNCFTIEDLHLLEPYFFYFDESINSSTLHFPLRVTENESSSTLCSGENIKYKEKIFFPKQNNELFWAIYVQIYGFEEYDTIKSGFSNVEMEERIKIMNYFKENPHVVANSNIKITQVLLKELMSELLSCEKTSIISLYIYALYYKVNIYLVNQENHTYIEFLTEALSEEKLRDSSFLAPGIPSPKMLNRSVEKEQIFGTNFPLQYTENVDSSTFASTSFSQNSFSPTLCSGENVKIRSDEFIKCKKIKNIIIFTSSTKYEKQETNTKVSLKKRFWSMTVENTLIKSLRDSTERSVEEDQFAVACEGKSKESLNFFKDTYFKLENAIKPLKGISNYKIQELENILKIVNFLELRDLSKRSVEEDLFCEEQSKGVRNKMKKQDIYNKIINIITTV